MRIYGLSEDNRYEDFRNSLILNNQNVASTYGEFIAASEGNLDPIRLESSEEALEEYYTNYKFYTNSVEFFKERNFSAVQYQNEVDKDYTGVMLSRRNLTENRGKRPPASSASRMMGFAFRT